MPDHGFPPPHPDRRRVRLAEATAFALAIHGGQHREGTAIPCVSRLFGVASLVPGHGGDADQAIAALPHDAIEDQGAEQRAPVRDRFGERGLLIVEGCSDADVQPTPPWRARKGACPAHLEHAAPEILLVSCTGKPQDARAIRTDLRAAGPAGWDRFRGGRDGTPWFRGAPAAVFERLMPAPLAAELAETVRELRQPDQASG